MTVVVTYNGNDTYTLALEGGPVVVRGTMTGDNELHAFIGDDFYKSRAVILGSAVHVFSNVRRRVS